MNDETKSRRRPLDELSKLRQQNRLLKDNLRELKLQQTEWKNTRERLQTLIENTSDSIFCYEYDPPIPINLPLKDQIRRLYEGTLVECNDICAQSYGAKRAKDVIGKKLTELFGTAEGSLDDMFSLFIRNGYQTSDAEGVEILPDGNKRYYLNNGYGIIEQDKLARIWGTYRDITPHKQAEEELRSSEERLKILFEYAPDSYFLYDLNGSFIDGNQEAEKTSGYSREELIGQSFLKLKMLPPEQLSKAAAALKTSAEGKSTGPEEYTLIRKDGTQVNIETRTHPLKINNQTLVLAIAHDITERKRAKEELEKRETHQALVLDSLPMAFYTAHPFGDYGGTWVSKQIESISGFTPEQFLKETQLWSSRLHPDDRDRALKEFESIEKKRTIRVEYRWRNKNGEYLWILDNAVLIKDPQGKSKEIIGTWLDITESKKAQEKIKASLHEKEFLLREIHHRVKNNMQIITSLLRLQARSLKDQEVADQFLTSQNRIKSMALIHESLYRAEDLARIDFTDYLRKITVHLFTVYRELGSRINLQIKGEGCYFDINRAIPCGQIVNELVTNSLKHAFPAGKKGNLFIELNSGTKGKFHLSVKDNGIGFPQDLDFRNTKTLGLQLVMDLVNQLKGTIEMSRDKGTTFKIQF